MSHQSTELNRVGGRLLKYMLAVFLLGSMTLASMCRADVMSGSRHGSVPIRPWLAPAASSGPTLPDGPEIELTLPEAIGLGLRQNRNIKSVLIQRIVDRFNLRVEEDLFTPKLITSVTVRRDTTSTGLTRSANVNPVATLRTPVGTTVALGWSKDVAKAFPADASPSNTNTSSLNLSVVQPLLRGAGLDVNMAPVRTARISERQSLLQAKATLGTTVNQIIHAHHRFLQEQEQIKIVKSSLLRAREVIDINKALIAASRMAANDLIQAEVYVSQQELALLGAESALDSARLTLLSFLALDPRTRIVAMDKIEGEEMHLGLDQAKEIAFSRRADHLAQLLAVDAARIALDVAKNARKWDVSLIAGSARNTGTQTGAGDSIPAGGSSRSNYVGLQLSFPVGDLRPEQAELQAAAVLKQANLQLETLRASIEQMIQDGVRNIDILWRQYLLARKARDLAARNVDLDLIKLRSGRSSTFQVRQSQDDLLNAQNSELTARVSYVNALVDMDEQLGLTLDTWQIELPQGVL